MTNACIISYSIPERLLQSSEVITEFIFILFCLSMPIDNATRHARVGIFCTQKSLHKSKPTTKNISYLDLFLIYWNYFVTFNLNIIHFDNILSNKSLNFYSSFVAKISKKIKITTFFISLCFKHTDSMWGC